MKVFLDDLRDPPDDSWTVCRTAQEAIDLLWADKVTEISLDHDLGEELTGYDVACVLEEMSYDLNYVMPIVRVHSANPVGRKRIQLVIDNIERWENG